MNGFQLSGELLLLREQIRRVVQEEIVPLEPTGLVLGVVDEMRYPEGEAVAQPS